MWHVLLCPTLDCNPLAIFATIENKINALDIYEKEEEEIKIENRDSTTATYVFYILFFLQSIGEQVNEMKMNKKNEIGEHNFFFFTLSLSLCNYVKTYKLILISLIFIFFFFFLSYICVCV